MSCVQKYRVCVIIRKIERRTEKQCFWRFIIILSIIFSVMSEENCSVSWELTTVPIFFGDDISLKCTAKGSGDCFGSRIFKWIGGPEKEVISFDVQVYDHSKYTVFHERGHYWLVIKNCTARDIDIPYACHCGFNYLESILKNVSTTHSDDQDDSDHQKNVIVHTLGDKRDKGKAEDVSSIVGSCVGAFLGVIVVISIVYAVIKRYKKETAGSNDTKKVNREQEKFI